MRAGTVNSRTIGAIATIAAAALAIWTWRAHAEVTRLGQLLGAASAHIEQLNDSLAKARDALNQTREELDRSLDDAEQARQTQAASGAPTPAYTPVAPAQPVPTNPIEMAQLQASQSLDTLSSPVDAVLELKGRH